LRAITSLEKEIEVKGLEISKCERDINETEKDEALPPHKRRQRRRNEDGVLEKPWPREYENERRVLNNKIAAGNAYIVARNETARSIQSQYNFFANLVQQLTDIVEQSCPVCLEDKVCISSTLTRSKGRGRQGVRFALWSFYL
jgi:hypothetical protein